MMSNFNGFCLRFCEATGAVKLTAPDGRVIVEQYGAEEGLSFSDINETTDGISFNVKNDALEDPLFCRYTLDAEQHCLKLTMDSDGGFEGMLKYPPAYKNNEGELVLYPLQEGIAFYSEDSEVLLPGGHNMAGGAHMSMGFFGKVLSDNSWMLCAIMNTADGKIINRRTDGLYNTQFCWIPQKCKWGNTRELRYIWGETGGITGLCSAYRKIAGEKGFIKPFTEKRKLVPGIDRLVGSADVWLWNDNAMDLLYSETTPYSAPTKEQLEARVEVAEDMKKSGMSDVLWSVFNENIDKETVAKIKELGYLTTYYDIYTDVIPADVFGLIPTTRQKRCVQRLPLWPDGIIRDNKGEPVKAWQLKCTDGVFRDQARICDAAAIELAGEIIPKRGEEYGLEGTFLDVAAVSSHECFCERHPMTRDEAMGYKRKLMNMVSRSGQVVGTEIGCEDVAAAMDYNEGMLSPPIWRTEDSGRRMTHQYFGDEVRSTIPQFMLNPKYRVPLWELIYHGCVQSYFYWGDSNNCCPELMEQCDRFLLLYGLAPIYCFTVSGWEAIKDKIVASYNRTVPNAKKVGFSTMESFEYLNSDRTVQRTVFSNGTVVTVNFSDKEFTADGLTLLPGETDVRER